MQNKTRQEGRTVQMNIITKNPKTLLNKGSGFLSDYSHSLNPYTGCSFGCSYCYVRQMPVSLFRGQEWGTWVDIKNGASDILRKELRRSKAKGKVTIFMSSSTDPYQPIEYQAKVTRSLLEVMVEDPPDFLLVQTRSPLVRRDIDILQQLGNKVRVSMTVETDLDEVRKHFSPYAPPIQARLRTLQDLAHANIPTQAAIAPLLPSSSDFARKLKPLVNRVCVDDYFMGDGSGGKRTRNLNISSLYKQLDLEAWYHPEAYRMVYDRFVSEFQENQVYVSQAGFAP
ncbi:radical SAM protein [Paenibacillus selenitireducens]|uniref:Radical SAM protein n=2 Tax=Paenibacillus selenitireducens TaxID=1324314 RepID=A0A1T2X6U2_9BACL|nr:radical SAM protein [Paenibacillus selenitireducens]OPA75386.1 radical SAM protein [Paenibacillus selenitireducens]